MPALRLDGRKLAERGESALRERIAQLIATRGRAPGLGVLLVGEHAPSQLYVRNKARLAARLGLHSQVRTLPAAASMQQVLAEIERLNHAPELDAFLVQLPLPAHLDTRRVLEAISPLRDVDGITPHNAGLWGTARGVTPCTPRGCMKLIAEHRKSLRGLHAVVVGRSAIVGRPVAQLLLAENATVTLCHRHTPDVREHTRRADVLVMATGVPHLVGGDDIKPGATVIDVGLTRVDAPDGQKPQLLGDVEPESAAEVAGALTPVPGGVGPMTLAMLMANTVQLAEAARAGHSFDEKV